ncbi:MAG: HEPN domain-containing protein [Actinomycetota bacterium]
MSAASKTFEYSISDARALLEYFDASAKSSPTDGEVLKRAGLIMASVAWETYIEERLVEEVTSRLANVDGSRVGRFMIDRLNEDLRRCNNPTSEKVRKLYRDYLEVDITASWEWDNYKAADARRALDKLISTRGDIAHRSNPAIPGKPYSPHPVKREDLAKAIRFLAGLVQATERALS